MELLLDTHTLLWVISGSDKLPEKIKNLINNYDNKIFVSMVSLWEIEIKHALKPDLMPISAEDVYNSLTVSDFHLLSVRTEYIVGLLEIIKQNIHKDPFDHLLLSMANDENMTLVTHDDNIQKYHDVSIISY